MKARTGIDRLLSVLEKEKDMPLSDIADRLDIDKDQVREWVDFLVEKNRVMVHYNFMTPYVTLLDPKGRSDDESTRKTLSRIRKHQKKFSTAIKTEDAETASEELEKIEDLIDNLDDPSIEEDVYNDVIAYPERIKKIGGTPPELHAPKHIQNEEDTNTTESFKELFQKVKKHSQSGRLQEAQTVLMRIKQKADRTSLSDAARKQIDEKVKTAEHHIQTVKKLRKQREAS